MSEHVKTSQGPQKHLRPQRVNMSLPVSVEITSTHWRTLCVSRQHATICVKKSLYQSLKEIKNRSIDLYNTDFTSANIQCINMPEAAIWDSKMLQLLDSTACFTAWWLPLIK